VLRQWLVWSLCVHALLIAAALGRALPRPEVVMPRVAAVSITNAATPPAFAVAEPADLPRPDPAPAPDTPPPDTGDLAPPPPPRQPEAEPDHTPPPPDEFTPPPVHPVPPRPIRAPVPTPEPAPLPDPLPESQPAVPAAAPRPAPAGPLDSADCDRAPVLDEVTWPRALRRGFEGKVIARVEIDEHGRATRVELLQGTGRENWDAELLRALREAAYRPAWKDGRAVACRHVFRIEFARQ
jgi:TonB family protein